MQQSIQLQFFWFPSYFVVLRIILVSVCLNYGGQEKTSLLINNTMELTTQNLSLLNISQRLSGVEI